MECVEKDSFNIVSREIPREKVAISAYSFRHIVSTVLRRSNRIHAVTDDDVSLQLGHKRPQVRTTAGYGEWEPDYLLNASKATDTWFATMQKKVRNRELFPRVIPESSVYRQREWAKSLKTVVGATRIEPVTPTMSTSNDLEENLWFRPIWPDFP